jgi:hypothetical protein
MSPVLPQRFAVAVATVLLALAPGSFSSTHAAERSRLIVRGRVLDQAGAPIRGAWVVAKGSRRAASLVDTAGSYVLTVPGATALEMSRSPVRIRLQARCRSWKLSLTNGAPELGIEMRVVDDGTGPSQLLVRSNDPVVAAQVANAAVLEASPLVILQVDFVGAPGVQEEDEAVDLSASQRVSFFGAGGADTVVPLEVGTPAAQGIPSRGSTRSKATVAEKSRSPRTSGVGSGAGRPRDGATTPARAYDPALRDSIDRLRRLELERTAKAAERTEQADRSPMVDDSGAGSQAPAPGVVRREQPRPIRGPDASRANAAAANPSPAAASPVSPPATVSPVSPPPTSSSTTDMSATRAPVRETRADRKASACGCQVRGIVEIDSDRPLNETLPVVVFLEDEPAARDTVELFMGSPRAFQLKLAASCGMHRVRFETRSKQRYRLTSREPLVDCTGGGTRGVRLVLAPVGRGSPFR